MTNHDQSATASMPADHPLQKQIAQMQMVLRKLDLIVACLMLAVLWTAAMLVFIVCDSWVFSDGFSVGARLCILAIQLTATLFYIVFVIVPRSIWMVRPAYAAMVMEQEQPSLKNAVLNWFLIGEERRHNKRLHDDPVAKRVWKELGKSAAATICSEQSHRAGRLTYHRSSAVFLGLLLVFMVYAMVSPKSPLPAIGRLLNPLSEILPAQRLYFRDTKPGNETRFQGEHVAMAATLSCDPQGIPVEVAFTTDDGRYVEQRVPMTSSDDKANRFECRFPPNGAGLESSLRYWFVCGDSRSTEFRIDVREGVSIDVESLRLTPPRYTGQESLTISGTGNAEAVVGTELRLDTSANVPLQTAYWVPGRRYTSGSHNRLLTINASNQRGATATWMLNDAGEHSYTLHAIDTENNESLPQRASVYTLTVRDDKPPVVAWDDPPPADVIEVPLNGSIELGVTASDPDYALRAVRVVFERNQAAMNIVSPIELITDAPSEGPTQYTGQQRFTAKITPREMRMREGEVYTFWCEADDTKLPHKNTATSEKLQMRVVAPQQEPPPPTPPQDQPNATQNQQQDGAEQGTDTNENPSQSESGGGEGAESSGAQQGSDANKNSSQSENGDGEGAESSGAEQGSDANKNPAQSENGDGEGAESSGVQQGSDASQNGSQGESGAGSQPKSPQDKTKRIDPDTQPGDAIDKIREHMERGAQSDRTPDQTQRRDDLDPNSTSRDNNGQPPNTPPKHSDNNKQGESGAQGQGQQQGENGAQGEGQQQGEGGAQGQGQGQQQGEGGAQDQGQQQGENGAQGQGQQQGEGGAQGQGQQQGENGSQGSPSEAESAGGGSGRGEGLASDGPSKGGGGRSGNSGTGEDSSPDTAADANLDYTRQTTNLVLEYLEEQLSKKEPDSKLLESLGWSRDDLERFVASWKKAQTAAATDASKQRDYAEWLRSVGIRSAGQRTRSAQDRVAERTNESLSPRATPPAAIRERFKGYTERIGSEKSASPIP